MELSARTVVQKRAESKSRNGAVESITSFDEAVWQEEERRDEVSEPRKETSEDSGGRSKLISAPRQKDEVRMAVEAFVH